jgi:hypothetical protein
LIAARGGRRRGTWLPTDAIATFSWAPEESQVESYEHQDNADIRHQPFPESVSEELEIYTHYDRYHRHHVKRDSYLSAHSSGISQFAFSMA